MIKKIKNKIVHIYRNILSSEFRLLPASLAFSFTLAIIPIFSLVVFSLSSINVSASSLNRFLVETFNHEIADMLTPIFNSSITTSSFFGILLSIIVCSNGCNAIILASNSIYHIKDNSFFRRYIKAIFLTMLIIVIFAFILMVPLLGKQIINILCNGFAFIGKRSELIYRIYNILNAPLTLLILFFIIKAIYIVSPDEEIRGKFVNRGALFTTVGWFICTALFSYYINNVANYHLVYGNLANLVILLLWFLILSYIFVIGIIINKDDVENGINKMNDIKFNEIKNKIKENK